jgi:hypothetical protein
MPGARAHLAMQPFIVRMMRVRFNSKADVAQLVEQLIRNQQVSGSTPLVGSIQFNNLAASELLLTPRDGENDGDTASPVFFFPVILLTASLIFSMRV